MNKVLLEIKNVGKTYFLEDFEAEILRDVNLKVEAGEFVSIMGPSGSGKSTLMHIMGLLDRSSVGEYIFKGKNVSQMDDEELASLRNAEIGFVFQAFNLLSRTTVLDNVKLPLIYSKNKKEMNKRAEEVLTSVGLAHRLNFFTNQISGGEKQRVAIARALVNKPSIIFADEPTGNLDTKSGTQVMNILQELNDKGVTIILVTHENYTAEHAKRIIRILDGKIVSDELVKNRRFAKDKELIK